MPDDWITNFVESSANIRSAYSFRLWTAISTIAAVLERRVWMQADHPLPLYPNFYTVLAGAPGSGKTTMTLVARSLLVPIRDFHLASDNPTKASFMDELERAIVIELNGSGKAVYSALTVSCREFGVFLSKYDTQFLADLSDIYDNPPIYTAPRRISKSVSIEAPTVNMLIGATPDAIDESLPSQAWGQGFTSRLILIYGATITSRRKIFGGSKTVDMSPLQKPLENIRRSACGELRWTGDAQAALECWINDEGKAPVPTHNRLRHYCERRDVHVMKLAMVSAASANHFPEVLLSDFLRGKEWLLEAEKMMPNVFHAMGQKSDTQILQDLHHEMYVRYSSVARDKRKPISDAEVWKWLTDRVPSERISTLIQAAERSGLIRKDFTGGWTPMPIDPRGTKASV